MHVVHFGSFDGSNDGKPVRSLLAVSVGEDVGTELGSSDSSFDGSNDGKSVDVLLAVSVGEDV